MFSVVTQTVFNIAGGLESGHLLTKKMFVADGTRRVTHVTLPKVPIRFITRSDAPQSKLSRPSSRGLISFAFSSFLAINLSCVLRRCKFNSLSVSAASSVISPDCGPVTRLPVSRLHYSFIPAAALISGPAANRTTSDFIRMLIMRNGPS